MYSRWAEWTAAALLYRHKTITEDKTSSTASNCGQNNVQPVIIDAVLRDLVKEGNTFVTYSKSKSRSTVAHDGHSCKKTKHINTVT